MKEPLTGCKPSRFLDVSLHFSEKLLTFFFLLSNVRKKGFKVLTVYS